MDDSIHVQLQQSGEDYIPEWKAASFGVMPGEKKYGYRELGLEQEHILGIGFFRYLYNVTHVQKLSLLILSDGRHRAGKSLCWVTTGCILDDTFERDMEKRVCYDAESFLDIVQEINEKKIPFPFIMVDEAGSSLNASDWYEKMQKAIIKAITIIGFLHPTIVFITTNRALMLGGVKKQAHLYVHIRPDSARRFSKMLPYHVVWNPLKMDEKPRYRKIRISMYGRRISLDVLKLPLPPKHIFERYTKLEMDRKPKLLANIREDVTKSKIKKEKEFFNRKTALDQILELPEVFGARKVKNTWRYDDILIKTRYKIPTREAMALKRMAEQVKNEKVSKESFFMDIEDIQKGDE